MDPTVSLFRRCVEDRDAHSWEEFVSRYGRLVRRKLQRTLHRTGKRSDPDLLEDLTQDVYCRLLERAASGFRGKSEAEVVAYLSRVADNVVLDRLRSSTAQKRSPKRISPAADPWELISIPDSAVSPEERTLAAERRQLFLERCRQVVRGRSAGRDLRMLRWAILDGWTSREIASALRGVLAPSSVDSQLHRLRRRLAAAGMLIPSRLAG